MRILVTGGAGFVGTNLIKRLLKDGYDVCSYDNYSAGFEKNEQQGCEYYVKYLRGDFKWGKFDIVFHLAALARIQPSLYDPYLTLRNNFDSTLNVLEYANAIENDTKVIYAGSSSKHHGLYKSPYAWSKCAGEGLCKLYSSVYDLKTTICRFYNVYGPHQITEGTYSTVIGIFENQYKNNKPLTIVGNGEQRRDFTHINDIVDALVCLIDKDYKAEVFELGSGKNYSINQIADMFGEDYPRKYLPKRAGEYDTTLADYSNAEKKLNWKAVENLEEYIEQQRSNK